jgi:hypothetical protein
MLPACRTADEPFAIPQFALTRSDIDAFMDELRGFHTAFRDFLPGRNHGTSFSTIWWGSSVPSPANPSNR